MTFGSDRDSSGLSWPIYCGVGFGLVHRIAWAAPPRSGSSHSVARRNRPRSSTFRRMTVQETAMLPESPAARPFRKNFEHSIRSGAIAFGVSAARDGSTGRTETRLSRSARLCEAFRAPIAVSRVQRRLPWIRAAVSGRPWTRHGRFTGVRVAEVIPAVVEILARRFGHGLPSGYVIAGVLRRLP